ncbi:enoyl-[acyl-carrier-protein] reductase FabV [Actinacidiphila sp. ITFR-21]|uniref:enoyl-[acyl-carrier-protein] reductase FabV n=1 Tax=Actinacidiphila sp. ITFR-21 TaxID=3075199 RepID=UPI00288B86CF|nr:enoyl-[acyl-carrier-protein] reductase FabV [Streptomyces sp. ITFR-21]WNI18969.1 enoyl-[acyl-carrier-protein] reductase FabV [Streptomyces sp. ITFR-21]
MSSRVVRPDGRGFLLFDAHPAGCARLVDDLAAEAGPPLPAAGRAAADRPVAVVIGSSAGYGLAATLAGVVRHGMHGVAVCFEKPAAARRTATAGWYRSRRVAQLAEHRGSRLEFVNADCFQDSTRERVLSLVEERFGRVDHLIYSVAAPRRPDPLTGRSLTSVIKPLGAPYPARMLGFDDAGAPRLVDTSVEPATEEQRRATVHVMGGGDWAAWVTALAGRNLLGPRFRTVALSYVGSELTAPIYRRGTIGAAKDDLEATARQLTEGLLAERGGAALTSVNGVAVTPASMAIPGIALYSALLRRVLGERMQSPLRQMVRLWDLLADDAAPATDATGRLRLDDWELLPQVQAEVADAWHRVGPANLEEYADTQWLRTELLRLYGFEVPGVDYTAPVETELPWPESTGPALTSVPAGPPAGPSSI